MPRLHLFAAAALAPLMFASAPSPAQPAAQLVVTMANYAFTPRPIRLVAGRPVTLTFVNRSGGGHDFTAREFFASSRITAGAAPGGEVELRGGESRSVTLIPARGSYKAHCGHFMHSTFGMTDRIIVE